MSALDKIHQIARETLITPAPPGGHNDWLWDRTVRILGNVEQICRLPELAEQAMSIDRFCLVAGTYFADSGQTHSTKNHKGGGRRPLTDITTGDPCAVSTQIVSDKLADVISETRIDKINKIITESVNRFTDVTEAMILSDGRGLEDLGAAGLIGTFRRQLIDGKSISDILDSWNRKVEYGYWQARLKESFRFAAVRAIAEQRFAAAEQFMGRLAMENTADDLQKQLALTLKEK